MKPFPILILSFALSACNSLNMDGPPEEDEDEGAPRFSADGTDGVISGGVVGTLRATATALAAQHQRRFADSTRRFDARLDSGVVRRVLADLLWMYRSDSRFRDLFWKHGFRPHYRPLAASYSIQFLGRDSADCVNDPALRGMMAKYPLKLAGYEERGESPYVSSYVRLQSSDSLIAALFLGEYYALQPDGSSFIQGGFPQTGDGDEAFVLDYSESRRKYRFSLGWDHCGNGCRSEHYWVYDVAKFSVTLTEEGGSPLPARAGAGPRNVD